MATTKKATTKKKTTTKKTTTKAPLVPNLEKEEVYNIFKSLTREILVYRENILENNII